MEIMGLIVIVVLLALSMFFVVIFKTTQPKKEIQKSFSDDQLASKFLITTLKTSAGCRDYTIESLIQDCATDRRISCNGVDSCEFVKNTTKVFVNETFVKYNSKYNFTIENLPTVNITFSDSCSPKNINRDLAWQPLTLYPHHGTVIVKIYICK